MTEINDILEGLCNWLKSEPIVPQLKSVAEGPGTTAAYPAVSVNLEEEAFNPLATDATALINLRVQYAAGRPDIARRGVGGLAHAIRRSLNRSHKLVGLVKGLRITGISYPATGRSIDPVVAEAVVHLEVLYTVHPL